MKTAIIALILSVNAMASECQDSSCTVAKEEKENGTIWIRKDGAKCFQAKGSDICWGIEK